MATPPTHNFPTHALHMSKPHPVRSARDGRLVEGRKASAGEWRRAGRGKGITSSGLYSSFSGGGLQ
jgi:hypothetical protein